MYKVRTCRTGNPVNRSTSISPHDHIPSASVQRTYTATHHTRWA